MSGSGIAPADSPACNRPAEFTDLDHRIAFTAGGRTTADNLQCLCRHHHRLKHEGGWKIQRHPDGSHTWTSPTGRHYRENGPPSKQTPVSPSSAGPASPGVLSSWVPASPANPAVGTETP